MTDDLIFYNDIEAAQYLIKHNDFLDFDVDLFKREGLTFIPHVSYKLKNKTSNKNLHCWRSSYGDVLKSIKILGKNIVGYKILAGNDLLLFSSTFDKSNEKIVTLGKIGLIFLNLRFTDIKIHIDCDEMEEIEETWVLLPEKARRTICFEIEMIDDSILDGVYYKYGCIGPAAPVFNCKKEIMFDWKECYDLRRIIDSKKTTKMVWLEEIPEIIKLLQQKLDQLNIKETVIGNMVTLGCYSSGQFFSRHKDCPLQGGTKSLLVYLNYTEGGETVFYKQDNIEKIKPATGTYVIFDIYEEHESLPLLRGQKYILGCELK